MATGDRYRATGFGPSGWGTYDIEWSDARIGWTPATGDADLIVVPGFIDIHVHGAFGIDFMSAGHGEIGQLCQRLGEVGYEGFLPTTVSASAGDVKSALTRLPEHSMILGFHLEGPFISPEFPGAQPPEAIQRPPSGHSEWDAIFEDPRLRVVTMAPEPIGALDLIGRLAKRGIIVSMGHSGATWLQAEEGQKAGARHATHTFNAMRGLHHREPGMAGFALTGDVDCEMIYDRLHVSKQAAQILLKCKTPERVIAVSDGTMVSGLGDGHRAIMWNHAVETRSGGVYLEGTNTLAGSSITLLDAFRNLAEDFGGEVATRLCCLNPRRAMALSAPARVYVEFDQRWGLEGVRKVAAP